MAEVLVNRFLSWSTTVKASLKVIKFMIVRIVKKQASKYWSGYANLVASENGYAFVANVMYVGTSDDGDDINSFDDFFKDIYPENLIDRSDKTFDTFYQKLTNQVRS